MAVLMFHERGIDLAAQQIGHHRATATVGTCTPLVLVCCQNSLAVRWSLLPLPDEAKGHLARLGLWKAITSASDLWGDGGRVPPAHWAPVIRHREVVKSPSAS